MYLARISCILALLCFAVCVAENTETAQGFTDLKIHHDSSAWLNKLEDKQVSLVWLLHKLSNSPNKIIQHGQKGKNKREETDDTSSTEDMAPRHRKNGCRIFFWKSWTSC
uniref:Somatostatin/Cortistatin C-terminal domain-containing protein n=1 Tax=Myripristis murdjan TaxID=586833 RepID=A0A667WLA5_9TELE